MKITKVLWKNLKIKHFEHYKISNYGQVLNTRTNYKTFGYRTSSTNERLKIRLNNKELSRNVSIAKLVLTHFKKDEIGLNYALHLNGRVQDNDSSNLKWGSLGDLLRMKHKSKNKKRGAYRWIGAGNTAWRALIRIENKMYTIGYYKTKEEAYSAYFNRYVELFRMPPWIS